MRRLSWKAGPRRCCPHGHDRLRGRANDPRTNAGGADAAVADDGNDEADEPDDGSLLQHDAGRPAQPQGRACQAGEEGLTINRPMHRCDGAGHSYLQRGTSKEAHMNRLLLWVLIALALGTVPSVGQSQQPYAGLEGRSIKALSEQQIADLRAMKAEAIPLGERLIAQEADLDKQFATPSFAAIRAGCSIRTDGISELVHA